MLRTTLSNKLDKLDALLTNQNSMLKVAATFRLFEEPKVQFPNVKCYNISKMKQIIKKEDVEIVVLALPNEKVKEVEKLIVESGVKAILNFTSVNLEVPSNIRVEQYDLMSKLEKLAYFTNSDK